MKMRLFWYFALLLLTAIPHVNAQSQGGDQSAGAQQGTSADCTATGENCAQSGGQNGQQTSAGQYGVTTQRTQGTTPTTLENSTSGQGSGQRAQQRLFPPEMPSEFQKFVAASTGQILPVFGQDLFNRVPSTFSPDDLAPATPEYVIGPDDELRVHIWGQVNYSGNLQVDRSGSIYIPQVGQVHVAGLHFSAVDQHMREAVGRIYRNFDLSVDMGRTRSMQIYVTGQARRPGVYTVSSLSTLVDTLFASGGPSPQGSLRHILVNREGKTITDFDLYALLIHGDKSKDVRLMPEDVLYIPAVGPQAAITGSIHNPGIYEMREGETLSDLLETAGKVTALSSNARISLDRVGQDKLRQAVEFPFDANGLAAQLADGDIIQIHSILPAYQKTVTLRGNVADPGRFGWRPGMHLSDLIPDRNSLVSRDYWWKRSHLGLPAPEFEPTISTIGEGQQPLEFNSRGLTTSVTQQTLTSALRHGTPTSAPVQGTPNSGLTQGTPTFASAQGTSNSGLTQRTPASDSAQGTPTSGMTAIDQQDAATSGSASPSPSTAESTGSLASQLTQSPTPDDSSGQAKRNNVRLSAPDINWDYAVIERLDPESLKTSLISFDLGKLVLNHDASQDLSLQPGDTITIFSQADIVVPLDRQTKYVDLEGEFVHSGIYSVQPGETLRDLVRRAGGFTPRAYLYGSEFTRESTRILQQQRLNEYVRNAATETERGTQALAVSGGTDVATSQALGRALIARLSQIRATGRIVLQFQPKSSSIDDVPEISLENGDRFAVPFAPTMINVVGAVYDQNSFIFQPARTVGQYLKLAGGTNRDADSRRSFVIRADGSVASRTADKGYSLWSNNSFSQLHLNPGDTIVVPDKTLRPSGLQKVLDWTGIFSQLAIGAAAINIL
jgi:protein involved in polysaccharide export with SLBB domain